ncbi:unnamed protein product [Brachionus calyciflorus]|uniref:AAA+ ATPase domain-containing protein n=1 Tax=Brachionus calyciflorus TaxID=104777 RepID=A0A813MAS1_9BILA|nr:unnamed protein product [Brachionus calyciflorus]
MSSKNNKKNDLKSKVKSWTQCPKCNLFYYKLSQTTAEHTCPEKLHDLFDSDLQKDQLFIFKNLGFLNIIENPKDITKDIQINKEYLNNFAFLNPNTMKISNLELGDNILVKIISNTNKLTSQFTCVCWPSNQIDQSNISLNKNLLFLNGLSIPQTVLVQKLPKKLQANEIDIEYVRNLSSINLFESESSQLEDTKLITGFLKEIYLNKSVIPGQNLLFNYMGQKLVFKIIYIDAKPESKKCNSKNLAVNFEKSLSLNDVSKNEKALDLLDLNYKDELVDFKDVLNFDMSLYTINNKTKFNLVNNFDVKALDFEMPIEKGKKISFQDIGGLDKEISILKEFFIDQFQNDELYKQIGVDFSKSVLLFGPSGCGKTMLAKAVCNETKCNTIELNISEVFSRNYGESESKLKRVFHEAWQKSPCIIMIDEIDTVCSRRETMNQELEKRVVSLFSNLIDQSKNKNVFLLCTTNKIDSIDLSLRRPGRLDKEIEIPIPNQKARLEILRKQIDFLKHNVSDDELLEISQNCHGYVGADLEMLVQEAGLCCIKRLTNKDQKDCTNKCILYIDLQNALRKVKPSAMREITFDIPKVYWHQIGGQHDLKKKLQQAIIWPIKYADSFKRLNIKPPRGLLMYGPPGCSKTMIAKALATETGLNFIAVKGPELFSKWVGESERMVREIFRKARNAAPAIIFFDEIDAVAVERSSSSNKSNNVGDRVLAQLLNEMDGVENLNDVTIVAATNRPDMIDKALMRPGRLDRIVYVKLPDRETRKEIFQLKIKKIPVADDISIDDLVDKSEKYSGAEIDALCNEAAFLALENDINCAKVNQSHFDAAFKMVTPRTSDETIKYFDNFYLNFGASIHHV